MRAEDKSVEIFVSKQRNVAMCVYAWQQTIVFYLLTISSIIFCTFLNSLAHAQDGSVYVIQKNKAYENIGVFSKHSKTRDLFYDLEFIDTTTGKKKILSIELNKEADNILPIKDYHWEKIVLANLSDVPQERILSLKDYSMYGTKFIWPIYGAQNINSMHTIIAGKPERTLANIDGSFHLTLPAKSQAIVILQVSSAAPLSLFIWQKQEFERYKNRDLLFGGILSGFLLLLLIIICSLFFLKPEFIYIPIGLLCSVTIAIVFIQNGLLDLLVSLANFHKQQIYYFIEAFFGFSILLMAASVFEWKNNILARLGYVYYIFVGITFFLIPISFVDNNFFMVLIRAIGLVAPILAFLIIFYGSFLNQIRCQVIVLPSLVLFMWGVVRIIFGFSEVPLKNENITLNAILSVALIALTFAIIRFLFDSLRNSILTGELGKRALALLGANSMVWEWHVDANFIQVDHSLESLLGYNNSDLIGPQETFLDYIHPVDRTFYMRSLQRSVANGGTQFVTEFRLRSYDGNYMWFQLKGRGFRGALRRVEKCIGAISDITGIKKAQDRLLEDSVHDRLTGYPNRMLFMDQLSRILRQHASKKNYYILVLYIDIDRFRLINEEFGYSIADNILLTFARRLEQFTSEEGTKSRLTSDKFGLCLILQEENKGQMKKYVDDLCQRILKEIARPIILGRDRIELSAKIGIAVTGENNDKTEILMREADLALVECKTNKLSSLNYHYFDAQDNTSEYSYIKLETALKNSLKNNEILVFYQPIIDLKQDDVVGFEALVRWKSKEFGMILPDDFLYIAEESGMIKDIGRYVLETAVTQLEMLQRTFAREQALFMSVNLANSQIEDKFLVKDIVSLLSRADISKGSLILEISETIVMTNPEHHLRIFELIKKNNVQLALDDFGEGNTSLMYLQILPIDILKLSSSFLKNPALNNNADIKKDIILPNVIKLAGDLGYKVVAEGLETYQSVEFMRELNAHYGQGFVFGRPMSIEDVLDFLTQYKMYKKKNQSPFWMLGKEGVKKFYGGAEINTHSEKDNKEVQTEQEVEQANIIADAPMDKTKTHDEILTNPVDPNQSKKEEESDLHTVKTEQDEEVNKADEDNEGQQVVNPKSEEDSKNNILQNLPKEKTEEQVSNKVVGNKKKESKKPKKT